MQIFLFAVVWQRTATSILNYRTPVLSCYAVGKSAVDAPCQTCHCSRRLEGRVNCKVANTKFCIVVFKSHKYLFVRRSKKVWTKLCKNSAGVLSLHYCEDTGIRQHSIKRQLPGAELITILKNTRTLQEALIFTHLM